MRRNTADNGKATRGQSTRFKRGNSGRPRGAKDKLPRSARATVNMILDEFGSDADILRDAILRGLNARTPSHFPFVRLLVEQHAGAPDQQVSVVTKVIHEIHET